MKMFKWFQNKKQPAKETHLQKTSLGKKTKQTQLLTSVTQTDFQTLYVATIQRFAAFLSEPNQGQNDNQICQCLDKVILALKKRQGHLLPKGADSEMAFREREEWTFAVFSAALLQTLEAPIRFAVAKAILPKQAFDWLHRNANLFLDWKNYLSGETGKNIFHEMLSEGQTEPNKKTITEKTNLPEIEKPRFETVAIKENNEEDVVKKEEPKLQPTDKKKNTEQTKPQFPKGAAIKEIDLREAQETPSVPENNEVKELSPRPIKKPLPEFKADDFWNWLKNSIENNLITANQTDSVVHGVEAGILICLPNAIDEFFLGQAKQTGIDEGKSVSLEQRIRLTKAIKKHEKLIRDPQGSRIHTYYLGKWDERNLVSGVVLKTEDLLGNGFTLPINPELKIDPIRNN